MRIMYEKEIPLKTSSTGSLNPFLRQIYIYIYIIIEHIEINNKISAIIHVFLVSRP